MSRTRLLHRAIARACLAAALVAIAQTALSSTQRGAPYRIATRHSRVSALRETLTDSQLALLEKLNRADIAHLDKLPEVVVPEAWDDEMRHSVLPMRYAPGEEWPTLLIVYLPGQLFGAYEFGALVRWGPISSGSRGSPTPSGLFALNWRSIGRASTVDPDWFMRWYFNFGNREGLAFHAYTLPGYPASHGCIRLLERDARWLFDWGQTWTLDSSGTRMLSPGTPVFIVGRYDFDAAPPWRSPAWLSHSVELPTAVPANDAQHPW